MSRLTKRAEDDGIKAVWYGKREVFLEGETGYAEADKLAHYEDLEEQGRLIELPCKVGDTVYVVDTDYTDIYDLSSQYYFVIECEFELYMITGLGIWVFLTKEEAEGKLKKLKEGVE